MRPVRLGSWLVASLLLIGCETDTECRQSSAIYMNVVFSGDSLRPSTDSVRLSLDSGAMDTVRFSTVSGLEIRGLGRDSVLYPDSVSISAAKLPLRPDTTLSQFVLRYQGKSDTLIISHQNDMQFISLACGCFVYHTLDNAAFAGSFVDSTDILNAAVTTASDTHLRIYFHTW